MDLRNTRCFVALPASSSVALVHAAGNTDTINNPAAKKTEPLISTNAAGEDSIFLVNFYEKPMDFQNLDTGKQLGFLNDVTWDTTFKHPNMFALRWRFVRRLSQASWKACDKLGNFISPAIFSYQRRGGADPNKDKRQRKTRNRKRSRSKTR